MGKVTVFLPVDSPAAAELRDLTLVYGCLFLGFFLIVLMVASFSIFEYLRNLDWELKTYTVTNFLPTTAGNRRSAPIKLHHGSMWTYLSNAEWDEFVLQGLGFQGRDMIRNSPRKLKVFEIGSGTGAALSTLVRAYPEKIDEVYGIEPAVIPAGISEMYFKQEHPGYMRPPNGLDGGIIREFASDESMSALPDNYYDQVMANGVLCYIPDIATLKQIVAQSMRILKKDGIFSATMLFDNEKAPIGYHYGSIQLAISQEHFWEALQTELGYMIISIEYMGTWSHFAPQKSRYAIQLRKVTDTPCSADVTDLSEAERVATPEAWREVLSYLWVPIVIVFLLLGSAAGIYYHELG